MGLTEAGSLLVHLPEGVAGLEGRTSQTSEVLASPVGGRCVGWGRWPAGAGVRFAGGTWSMEKGSVQLGDSGVEEGEGVRSGCSDGVCPVNLGLCCCVWSSWGWDGFGRPQREAVAEVQGRRVAEGR